MGEFEETLKDKIYTYTLNSLIINDDSALTGTYFRQLPIHVLFIDKIVLYNEIRQLLVFRCFNSV